MEIFIKNAIINPIHLATSWSLLNSRPDTFTVSKISSTFMRESVGEESTEKFIQLSSSCLNRYNWNKLDKHVVTPLHMANIY